MGPHGTNVKQERMRGEERNLAKLEMEDTSERLPASLERTSALLVQHSAMLGIEGKG